MSKKISIKQFLMKSGKFEKAYDCVQVIRSGKISINNKIITNPTYFFNPKNSFVTLDNEKIKQVSKLYLLLNKPSGYLSQKSEDEKTIYDLLKTSKIDDHISKSLFAVGRLDKDTEGLMLITNDGKLASLLLSPRKDVIKKYYVLLEKPLDRTQIKNLEAGIGIDINNKIYKTKPCKIKLINNKSLYISISEGKKRQIRKMFEMVDNKVAYLKRVSIGGLQLGNLEMGEIKQITRKEMLEKMHFDSFQQRL